MAVCKRVVVLVILSFLCLCAPWSLLSVGEYPAPVDNVSALEDTYQSPRIDIVHPLENEVLDSRLTYIEFRLVLAANDSIYNRAVTLDNYGLDMSNEGDLYRVHVQPSFWNTSGDAEQDFRYAYGMHTIKVTLDVQFADYSHYYTERTWTFEQHFPVDLPLSNVDYFNEFSIEAPQSSWSIDHNMTVGGTFFPLFMEGIWYDGPTGQITVKTTVQYILDPSIEENIEYVEKVALGVRDSIRSMGYQVNITKNPQIDRYNNRSVGLFQLTWPSEVAVTQDIAVCLDAELSRSWIIICTAPTSHYASYQTLFQEMIASFEAADPIAMGLVSHTYSDAYQISLPADWTVQENQTVGEVTVDVLALGQEHEGVFSNINVLTTEDANVQDDQEYLWSMVNGTITDLNGAGYPVQLVAEPVFLEIDGLKAVLFTVQWTSEPAFRQIMGLIVDDQKGCYWTIVCTMDDSVYGKEGPYLVDVITSFDVKGDSGGGLDSNGLPLTYIVTGAAVGAAAALGGALYMKKMKKK